MLILQQTYRSILWALRYFCNPIIQLPLQTCTIVFYAMASSGIFFKLVIIMCLLFFLVFTAILLILDCKDFVINWKWPLLYYLMILNTMHIIVPYLLRAGFLFNPSNTKENWGLLSSFLWEVAHCSVLKRCMMHRNIKSNIREDFLAAKNNGAFQWNLFYKSRRYY